MSIIKQPWGDAEKSRWLSEQVVQRSYEREVLDKVNNLGTRFELKQYGELVYQGHLYSLMIVQSLHWDNSKPTVLVTGGVHGYETSGVQGAIRFAETKAVKYMNQFNIIVAPCVSPWAYATINRWNPQALDPNRSFVDNGTIEESASLIRYINALKDSDPNFRIVAHFDLHETTDTDHLVYRPALAARDGKEYVPVAIPDGFFIVANSANIHRFEFLKAIINNVQQHFHIAPGDKDGILVDLPLEQPGVVAIPAAQFGTCMGFTDANYTVTTELYPDNPSVSGEDCINAQVDAITGGLDHIVQQNLF